ncbi:MAG: tetratricopeptide repeat protein, partial [Candidatus Eisenbacteria bacterium]|nr:tetratricopeptide repeat protein [Candidatus Eisenbacteria bacterium]
MAVTTPHTPPLPLHYLPRPRLDAVWQQAAAHRLILVTAGAGFGKTSFLAEQARKSARPVIWHSLEELDADPATFASRLAGTLRDLDSRSPARAEALAHKAGRLSDSALLASLLRAAIAHDSGIVLLFDDVQHVGQCAEALRFLERLAQALPDSCSMVLSSREPVPMATARLQSLGSVARIGTRDLQFTEEELSSFLLQRFPAAGIQPALVRRLLSETEGWAAGIEILLQASGGSPWAIEEALDRSTQAGAGWFAYFAEEVLGDLDPATREFLRRSSVLPSMEPGLCDRVLGVDDSAARLEALCSRNLFTFPIRRDPPSYRYHHLFREFLKDRLARESDPEEARRLRLRCAEELAAAGAWAEAAMEYAEGGDPRATLAVIERLGEKLLPAGNYRVLRRALESIPDSMLSQHPAALTVLGRMQETHGEWEEARRTYGKAILVARGLAKAELLSLLGQAHIRRGEYGEGERACVEALRQPGRKSAQLRGRVLCLLGVSAGEMGRLAEAERHFDRAIRIFRGIDDASGEGRVLCLLAANVHYYRGDYRRAKEAGRQALVLFQRLGDPHWICHSMMGIAQHAAAAGEPREARDLAERALRLAESLEYRMAEGYCHYTLGICALLARNPAAARMHLGRARQLGEQLGELSLLTWPQLGLAAAHLLEGNRPAAEILAREVLAHTRRGRSPYVEARCYV